MLGATPTALRRLCVGVQIRLTFEDTHVRPQLARSEHVESIFDVNRLVTDRVDALTDEVMDGFERFVAKHALAKCRTILR
jgi:hypothetical protein